MKIKRIMVVDDEYCYITTDTKVEVLKSENGVLTKTESEDFSMSRKDLSRQLQNINDDFAMLAAIKGGLHQKELILLLTCAELEMDTVFHAAGEVVGDYTYEYDTFERVLKSVKLSPRAEKKLDEALSL